jgi:hypothetical protein
MPLETLKTGGGQEEDTEYTGPLDFRLATLWMFSSLFLRYTDTLDATTQSMSLDTRRSQSTVLMAASSMLPGN